MHQFDHAVHQVTANRRKGSGQRADNQSSPLRDVTIKLHLPNNKTRDGSAQKCIGYDGAQVPEEVSLEEEKKMKDGEETVFMCRFNKSVILRNTTLKGLLTPCQLGHPTNTHPTVGADKTQKPLESLLNRAPPTLCAVQGRKSVDSDL